MTWQPGEDEKDSGDLQNSRSIGIIQANFIGKIR